MAGLRFLVPTIEVRILVPQSKCPSAKPRWVLVFLAIATLQPSFYAGLRVMMVVPGCSVRTGMFRGIPQKVGAKMGAKLFSKMSMVSA